MSPYFFQMVGVLQSKVEDELELLDVRSWGPAQLGSGGRGEKTRVWGPPAFSSPVSPFPWSWPPLWGSPSGPMLQAHPRPPSCPLTATLSGLG